MTAVTSSRRVDWEWERGGDWERIVERRTRSGVVLPVIAPTRLELRPIGAHSTVPAVLTVQGRIEDDGTAVLHVLDTAMAPLPLDRYQHRVIVTDGASRRPLVLLRGYVTLLDQTGDSG